MQYVQVSWYWSAFIGMRGRFSMRTFTLIVFAAASLSGVAFAQQADKGAPAKAMPMEKVEKVLSANPEPDGKAYRIELQLRGGKRVSYEIPPAEAVKIADGLSKAAVAGGQKQQVATLVYGMSVQADTKGEAVIISPRGKSGPLEPLAIPLIGAGAFVTLLQSKIDEATANAAKQPNAPKLP
jgi:hypothetical protein